MGNRTSFLSSDSGSSCLIYFQLSPFTTTETDDPPLIFCTTTPSHRFPLSIFHRPSGSLQCLQFRTKPSGRVEGIFSAAAAATAGLSVSNEGGGDLHYVLVAAKILNWMQQKLIGSQVSKKWTASNASNTNHINPSKRDAITEANSSQRVASDDWQRGLLTIGTFGNSEIDEEVREDCEAHEHNSSSDRIPELTEFTMEEIGKLKQELTKYLALKHSCRRVSTGDQQDPQSKGGSSRRNDCPLNKFLNCPSSLDVDRTSSLRHACDSRSGIEDPDNYYVVSTKGKDVCRADSASAGIRQRSLSLLLEKMFVCQGGFTLAPSIREPQLVESRIEKLMKTILHHKIYSQNSNSSKKFIRSKSIEIMDPEEESRARESNRFKWVKTDSEFIVLEM